MDDPERRERPRLPFITKLMKGRSRKEIDEANERFWGYIDIVKGIHERLESERSTSDDGDSGKFDYPEVNRD